jgi:hypothetical protein
MNPQGSPTEGGNVGHSQDIHEGEGMTGRREVVVLEEGNQDGGIIKRKKDGIVRIGYNNINGMGNSQADGRNRELHGFIKSGAFDIFGMSETNISWKNNAEHIKDIMFGWFRRMSLSYEYYRDYPGTASYQVGGVAQMAIGEITGRKSKQGGDKSGQGRWTWQTYKGKNNRLVRVITAYRPVKNLVSAGSVWNQQQYYADKHSKTGNPHQRWLEDLCSEIVEWIQQGESLIVLVDLNDNIMSGRTATRLRDIGLVERVTSFQQKTPTHQRGSSTIDGIFTTNELVPTDGGYVQSMSDHLCLWLDNI